MNSQLIVKFAVDVRNVAVDFSDQLASGETIVSGSVTSINPATNLTATYTGAGSTIVNLQVGGGTSLQSYGVSVQAVTSANQTLTQLLAVVVDDNIASAYQNQNNVAFSALVGQLEAGTSALGQVSFMFPADFNAVEGIVSWKLLDKDSVVYAEGQAFDVAFSANQNGVRVDAQALVGAPSDMLPTLDGQAYQVRWTLKIGTQCYYSFEQLTVTGPTTVPEGVEDIVELCGSEEISVHMVASKPWDVVNVQIYYRNEKVGTPIPAQALKVAQGYQYSAIISGFDMPADLEAYTLLWSTSNLAAPTYIERQTGRLFIVNPSIISATNDMKIMINKSYTSILGTPDILFTVPLLLAYLRRGRDAFNGAWGMFTGFTMQCATGAIREYWLNFSCIMALRAQYLAEGEKVFNFSGQAISLDVDRTQFYDQLANSLQAQLDQEGKAFKQNLIKKGIIAGDGQVDNLQIGRPGSIGTVGITLTPATNWLRFNGRMPGTGNGWGFFP